MAKPQGTSNYIEVSIETLLKKFDPTTVVKVSRKDLERLCIEEMNKFLNPPSTTSEDGEEEIEVQQLDLNS